MAGERLILTGFMGAGKSTSARIAAEVLGVDSLDTDVWMRTEMGIDVPALVAADPLEFRKKEAEALEATLAQEPAIIATGGGIVSTEVGRAVLHATKVPVVWLQVSFEEAVRRDANDSGTPRPLFQDKEKAYGIYQERIQWYKETSDYEIDADHPVQLVANHIIEIARAG